MAHNATRCSCVLQFAANTLEYMEDVDIEKTEDKIARHRADLRKHVLVSPFSLYVPCLASSLSPSSKA
jgi:hypothetical protein